MSPRRTTRVFATSDDFVSCRWASSSLERHSRKVQASVARLLAEQPDASLVIQADERVPHGKVVRVMDEAKAAGIANIAVAVAPK